MTEQHLNLGSATFIESIEIPFKTDHYRWPNGLHLIHQPDHGAPLVSYQTWVQVGSADEPKGKTGMAHFFEHLMFTATKNYSEGEFDHILEGLGAEVNAATWLDWTYFYADLPSQHLEQVIKLEADRLVHLQLTSAALEAERQVVMNERRECVEDSPDELISETLWYHLMPDGHPYAHSTIGWLEDIEGLTLEECEAFYRKYYSPNQIVIVVTGDVEAAQLLPLIERYYAQIPHSANEPAVQNSTIKPLKSYKNKRNAFKLSQIDQIKHLELNLDLHMPKVHLGVIAPSVTDAQSLAFECLDELLFEGDSSRIYKRLIYDLELASYVYSVLPQFRLEAVYEIGIELRPEHSVQDVQKVIFEELQNIAQNGVEAEELERVKCVKELQSFRSLQTVQQRAQNLGFWQSTAHDFKLSFSRLEKLKKVTSSDLQALALQLLDVQRWFMIIARPNTED